VLHSYDWSETSLIVELFTRERGRVVVAAKGAKRPTSQLRPVLLPFQRLHVQLGKTPADEAAEIHTLKSAEWAGGVPAVGAAALFSGFYLNELLLKGLARQDPHPALFDAYAATLAALADEFGVRVVADEIHAPIVLPGGAAFTPFLTVPGGERGFSVFSPSKGWNLAGLKSALVLAGAQAADDLARLHEVHTHGSSHIGAIAHVAALDDGRQWLAQLLLELDANRTLLARLLAEHLPGIRWQAPDATYLAWLDCRDLGLGDDPSSVFLRQGRVALGSGPQYGPQTGRGFVRLNLATSPEIIEDAVGRMSTAL